MKYSPQTTIKSALTDFKRNKIRTFLTALGITVGVLSVIMLIAVGIGMKNYISSQFENLGANIIVVIPGEGAGGGGFSALASSTRFHESDVRILERIDEVDYVAPAYIFNLKFESKQEEKTGTIIGTSESYGQLFALELIRGEFFDKTDVSTAAKVGYMSETLARDLYDMPADAVGRYVKFRNTRIRIKGVVKNTGVPERDNALFVPYTTTYSSLNPKKEFFAIYTGVTDSGKVSTAKEEIEKELLKDYEDDEFGIFEPSDLLESLDQIFVILNAVVVAIGSISLLVGGIGIMNIMYATVNERTNEVGIRRAVGATEEDILNQFLTESILLSLIGGLSGLAISLLIVLIVRPFFPLGINALSVGLALGVSTIIGVFFGVFPAKRAAKLPPIEAIRYE
ncbi:ABC transporter permease [Candidatus Woesebacteria bacterium]|nr:ABC transporter permease [Candidatus Woesebacteria bacterium]